MKFEVEYTINNVDCLIEVEAADLETAKQAINQWRVRKLRHSNNEIRITGISEKIDQGAGAPLAEPVRSRIDFSASVRPAFENLAALWLQAELYRRDNEEVPQDLVNKLMNCIHDCGLSPYGPQPDALQETARLMDEALKKLMPDPEIIRGYPGNEAV